jgi:hypothetical protein
MGYHNPDLPNALSLFSTPTEPVAWSNERLHRRFRTGNGYSLFRAEQLDSVYDDLFDEPMLRLEYDRFLPEVPSRPAD